MRTDKLAPALRMEPLKGELTVDFLQRKDLIAHKQSEKAESENLVGLTSRIAAGQTGRWAGLKPPNIEKRRQTPCDLKKELKP